LGNDGTNNTDGEAPNPGCKLKLVASKDWLGMLNKKRWSRNRLNLMKSRSPYQYIPKTLL